MSRLGRTAILGVSLGFAILVTAPRSFADSESCARAYESAQALRLEAKLLASKKELVSCAQDSCPPFVRKDCVSWLAEVSREIPAISVRVNGADGCDRPDAAVSVDGTPVARAAEGRPIEVDPGSHTVRVNVGGVTKDQVVVVTAGDRHRVVGVTFAPDGVRCGQVAPPRPPPSPPVRQEPETKPVPALVYAFAGVGITSAALATGFGISAWNQKGTLDDCKGHCATNDVDAMQRTFIVADVATVVAVLGLAAAGYLYFTR